ncbi:MAG: hypothetical protein J3R72DRAFT_511867 [Linnemannia gamsii]|nr:MAG: hypothetical protein J3R72DRAFT_511867 [Linnemannia gamsii]
MGYQRFGPFVLEDGTIHYQAPTNLIPIGDAADQTSLRPMAEIVPSDSIRCAPVGTREPERPRVFAALSVIASLAHSERAPYELPPSFTSQGMFLGYTGKRLNLTYENDWRPIYSGSFDGDGTFTVYSTAQRHNSGLIKSVKAYYFKEGLKLFQFFPILLCIVDVKAPTCDVVAGRDRALSLILNVTSESSITLVAEGLIYDTLLLRWAAIPRNRRRGIKADYWELLGQIQDQDEAQISWEFCGRLTRLPNSIMKSVVGRRIVYGVGTQIGPKANGGAKTRIGIAWKQARQPPARKKKSDPFETIQDPYNRSLMVMFEPPKTFKAIKDDAETALHSSTNQVCGGRRGASRFGSSTTDVLSLPPNGRILVKYDASDST